MSKKNELELTALQECLININWIFTDMYLDYQDAKDLKTSNRNYLVAKVSKYGYIQTCSFLEEYRRICSVSKTNDSLRDTLYVCAPVVRNLKKYSSGLKKMRNSMLAHVNRDRKGNFAPWWIELKGLRKPLHENDIKELYESLAFVVDMLNVRHKNEWDEVKDYLAESIRSYISEDIKLQLKLKIKEKPMNDINTEVLKRMKEKNIPPLNNII